MRKTAYNKIPLEQYLRNLQPQIGTFPIKVGPYEMVLLDYFRTCPCAQKLEINWAKISDELFGIPPYKSNEIPHWVCTNYNRCEFCDRCSPPLRTIDKSYIASYTIEGEKVDKKENQKTDTGEIINKDELERILNSDIGKFLIGRKDKVLVSPARLVAARTSCALSQEQVANMLGLSKQTISNSEKIDATASHKLNRIANGSNMITMKYSLCCGLSALYEVTPGYLMGQSDDLTADIYVNKTIYRETEHTFRKAHVNEPLATASVPIYEEYEVSPALISPICFFTKTKRSGWQAAEDIRESITKCPQEEMYSDVLVSNIPELVELCERIYLQPIPPELRSNLKKLFLGVLDGNQLTRKVP